MEIKVVFEVEEGSKRIIEKFSEAVIKLGDMASLQKTVENVIEKLEKTENNPKIENTNQREVAAGDWTTCDVKEVTENKVIETPTTQATIPVTENVETPVAEVPKAITPTYTDDELIGFCSQASQLGLGSKVKDIIRNDFGVMKVSEISADKREEFVNKLRGIGVRV